MENMMISMNGHILVTDVDTGSIMLDAANDIHRENMSAALASVMTNSKDADGREGFVNKLCFGSGGTLTKSNGQIVYHDANASGHESSLYNAVYQKNVNFQPENDETHTRIVHAAGASDTTIKIICMLDYNEPASGSAGRNSGDNFVFDEMGVLSQQGHLLTHAVFHPIRKGVDKRIKIEYSINIDIV